MGQSARTFVRQTPVGGPKQEMPKEDVPIGSGPEAKPAVEEQGEEASDGTAESVGQGAQNQSCGDEQIRRGAARFAEEDELGALILHSGRTAKPVGGRSAAMSGLGLGQVQDCPAHAAGALAPLNLFEEEKEVFVEQAEAREEIGAHAKAGAVDGFDGKGSGLGRSAPVTLRRNEPKQWERQKFLGERGQGREGVLQAPVRRHEPCAGDGESGIVIEAAGEGLESARKQTGIVIDEEQEFGGDLSDSLIYG